MPVTRIENVTVWTGRHALDGRVDVDDAIAFDADGILALGGPAHNVAADIVVDGVGGFVAPAFGDGHVHAMFGGLEPQLAPVRGHATPDAIARAVGAWAAQHPELEWLHGEGFDHSLAPDGVFLAAWLDAHVPDRPVVIRASDYHTVWVNSAALRRAGYTAGTPQPRYGDIVRDDAGHPVGTLREWGAWRPVYDLMPPPTPQQQAAALRHASACFAEAGITWVQDAWVEEDGLDAWVTAHRAGDLAFRADLARLCDPTSWRDQLGGFVATRERLRREAPGRLSATTVKFFADGVIESGTGALLEPYCDCPGSTGLPNWDAGELAAAVTAIDALGFDPHIHAIGDAAARTALDAIAQAMAANGPRDRRPVIAHAQLVDPADLGRFAELGVIANFEPYWARNDEGQTQLTAPRLGPERTRRQYPIRTVLDSGAAVSFGSDWPVSTFAPLSCLAVAVMRRSEEDVGLEPLGPHEAISVEQALAAYTSGVAFQAGDERAGTLRRGGRSDVVLLDLDPRRVPPSSIPAIEVLGTWCDGHRVHGG